MDGFLMSSAWAKIKMMKRRARHTFGGRQRVDGKEEFIIKIEGFSGELRRTMSEKEAEAWIEKTNKAAFMSAAKASKSGVYGVERFNKYGAGGNGIKSVMMRAAARSFSDNTPKADDKDMEK